MKKFPDSKKAAGLTLGAALIGAAVASAQAPFPEGPGRDTLLQVCTQCHAPNRILEADATAEDWEFILYDMIARGAPVHEEDIEALKGYLVDNFAVDE